MLRCLLQENADVLGNRLVQGRITFLPLVYAPVSQLHLGSAVAFVGEPGKRRRMAVPVARNSVACSPQT